MTNNNTKVRTGAFEKKLEELELGVQKYLPQTSTLIVEKSPPGDARPGGRALPRPRGGHARGALSGARTEANSSRRSPRTGTQVESDEPRGEIAGKDSIPAARGRL
jgi:hypothetical protein